MKNKILLYTVTISLFTFNSWTQSKGVSVNEKKPVEPNSKSTVVNDKDLMPTKRIKYYHVVEVTPLKFGGFTTTYDVKDPKLIRTYDLGPNNKRTVTEVYEDVVPVKHEEPTLKPDDLKKIESPAVLAISDKPKRVDSYIYVDIIKTYERVSEKGYESVDILKTVGNAYFFSDQLEKAEKCYGKLFSLTGDLEPEYYYRYGIALKAVGKMEQSNEYLKKFDLLSGNNVHK